MGGRGSKHVGAASLLSDLYVSERSFLFSCDALTGKKKRKKRRVERNSRGVQTSGAVRKSRWSSRAHSP